MFAIGSVVGPAPYPEMVGYFQSIVGHEARRQFGELIGGLPDVVTACVGGGSNALGLFNAFLDDESVRKVGVEPAGEGLDSHHRHAATLTRVSKVKSKGSNAMCCLMTMASLRQCIRLHQVWIIQVSGRSTAILRTAVKWNINQPPTKSV